MERHLAWKKNSQHLYDTLFVYELPWPSESVSWVPELVSKLGGSGDSGAVVGRAKSASGTTKQRIVLTTNTGEQAPEHLRVLELTVPPLAPAEALSGLDSEPGTVGGYQPACAADLHVVQQIFATGTIQQARLLPQNPNLVAVVSLRGKNGVFDLTKFPTRPLTFYKPTMELQSRGTGASTIALDCSPVREGWLATGDTDGHVDVFNLESYFDPRNSRMQPLFSLLSAHNGAAVNDVRWHPRRAEVLATCGDDGVVCVRNAVAKSGGTLLELRFNDEQNQNQNQGKKLPTALAWNPANDSLLAIGFSTGAVELWDVRTKGARLLALAGHADYVTRLVWNTWHPQMLASASVDCTTKVWNAAELREAPVFTHGGHGAPVTDVQWNPAVPHMLASVAEDNGLHVYAPSDDLLGF